MVPFSFAGQEFAALPVGAVYWPRRRALIVADLHFEKASWFAKHGQMLPPYDSAATLADLAAVIAGTDAQEVWCLGDSFHDADGCDRLPDDARARLQWLTGQLRWTWIIGNHDAGPDGKTGAPAPGPAGLRIAHQCGGQLVQEAIVDGLVLRHEADRAEQRPEMSGHFHPKLRLRLRGRHVARRCFVATEHKLILPAFGALTGGLDADHPEIMRAVGPSAEALVALDQKLLRYPISMRASAA